MVQREVWFFTIHLCRDLYVKIRGIYNIVPPDIPRLKLVETSPLYRHASFDLICRLELGIFDEVVAS